MKHRAPLALLLFVSGAIWAAAPYPASGWRLVSTLAAWMGSAMLVASLLLMVREPRLARVLGGLDAMYRWHHRCGAGAYLLLLMHPLALAADAWQTSSQAAWRVLSPSAQSWSVNLGWVALLLLMLGLAATFSPGIGYRRWRAMHWPLAIGVLLGLLHAFVADGGNPFIAFAAGLALFGAGMRAAVADRGFLAYPYRVDRVNHPAAGVVEADLSPLASGIRANPGQFVVVAFGEGPGFRGCEEFHPFTVSNVRPDAGLSVAIKAFGRCTTHVQAVSPGTIVRVQGPFGDFLHAEDGSEQLWIAGGIGITPFIARLRDPRRLPPTTLLYLYRHASDAAFAQELSMLDASLEQLDLMLQESGDTVADLKGLLARVKGLQQRQIHICGPSPLVAGLRKALAAHEVAAERIHWENFDFR